MTSPQGQRPSATVYRRRRIVVGVAALLVLILVIWGLVAAIKGIAGAVGGKDSAAPAATQTSSAPATTASGAPAGPNPDGSCPDGAVTITASTDKKTYSAKEEPVLIMSLKNTLNASCTLNVGTKVQEYLITSGSDRIFSTKDCQKDAKNTTVVLETGKEETARFTWDRTRTASGCAAVAATPQAGTYTLVVKLGDLESEPVRFVLK